MAEVAGELPLRLRSGGFEGLAAIVTAQQISTGAAASIWARLRTQFDPFTPKTFLEASDETLQSVGLSRAKISSLRNVASACAKGLDLEGLADLPAETAIARLTALKGIGPWTAEIYLLFCIGHADVFPAGDLALQSAAGDGLGLDQRPSDRALRVIASAWSPWRGVAARLLWAYYRVRRDGPSPQAFPGPPL
jgi:DNA-3-methyladenine glycosylase II